LFISIENFIFKLHSGPYDAKCNNFVTTSLFKTFSYILATYAHITYPQNKKFEQFNNF